jgi:RNA polymerase sigma-70 factor (ECF subfamily)
MTPGGDGPAHPRPPEAFLEPLDAQREKFLKFVRRRLTARPGARRDPEDVLQAAFVRAADRRAAFERSGMALDAWFYRVIDDALIDDHRFQVRQKRDCAAETAWPDRSSAQLAAGLADAGTSPSEAAGRRETNERVERVLGQLSPDHQQVIVLVHFAELSQSDAAEFLGVESGTVRQRYARARAQFRKAWKATYGESEFGG